MDEFPPANFTQADLSWQSVRVRVPDDIDPQGTEQIFTRLVLVNRVSRIAFDAGFGEIRRCRLLENINYESGTGARYHFTQRYIDIMMVRRTREPDARTGAILEGPNYLPIFTDPAASWVEIVVGNDSQHRYFTQGRDPIPGNRYDRSANPLIRLGGEFSRFAIELDNEDTLGRMGGFISKALCGEVRKGFLMAPPGPDGVYVQIDDVASTVAIKVIKHPLGAVPATTRNLAGFYNRENPMVEIEAMMFLAAQIDPAAPVPRHGHPSIIHPLKLSLLAEPTLCGCACAYCTAEGESQVLADSCNVYLVLPYMNGGDLFGALGTQFSQPNARYCLNQVFDAARFMHHYGVSHQDHSTENVMVHRHVDGSVHYVVIDFGQARRQLRGVDGEVQLLPARPPGTAPGKHLYYVPETFLAAFAAPYCGMRLDIWQLGVLMILVCTSSAPFTPNSAQSIVDWLNKVRRGELGTVRVRPPVGVPADVAATLHPHYPHEYEVIYSMLSFDPLLRPSSDVVLRMAYFLMG